MRAAALGPPKGNAASTRALKGAAGFWFLAALVGQWAFLYYLVSFYGVSTLTGNFPAWTKNTFVKMSYVRGDTVGNIAFGAHALLAAVIAFGGAIQLVPQIRKRALGFHRWMGRIFFVTALGLSVSGLYMIWVRHDRGNFLGARVVDLPHAFADKDRFAHVSPSINPRAGAAGRVDRPGR